MKETSKQSHEEYYGKFQGLTFEDFRRFAKDESLSDIEKIGFPDHYRRGYEEAIFEDIKTKLRKLRDKNKVVLDIGCGCSGLASMMIRNCELTNSRLLLADCPEMLSHLPERPFIEKYPGRFPDCPTLFEKYEDKVDVIDIYSVLHHVYLEANIFNFIDSACKLLRDQGEMLIGDIPNISKRKRFFSSKTGIEYHQRFTKKKDLPEVDFNVIDEKRIDDAVVFSILQRYRNSGFDTYLLMQDERLPMANRREDILIRKP